jgi:serine/threonine protein kinase
MSAAPASSGLFVPPDVNEIQNLFPGYEIEGLIAAGGMGAVYGAIQKSLDRPVALKILPAEFSKDLAFCAGFKAEAKAMARLNHPNLISVYDFGEIEGMPYIVMEFVPGQSIYNSANGTALDQREVIRLITGICNGLSHAHENGIIHRDIKPSNILLDLSARPKIGDFGLARPIESKIEEGEEIFGTPHYTAPEVVSSPQAVDFRADIYSVGVLIHEFLTGKLPADDPRPASVIKSCDPRFDAIIRKAMSTSPSARYGSTAEIAAALAKIAASLDTRAGATQGTKIGSRVPKRGGKVAGGPRVAGPRAQVKIQPVETSSKTPLIVLIFFVIAVVYLIFSFRSHKPVSHENATSLPELSPKVKKSDQRREP